MHLTVFALVERILEIELARLVQRVVLDGAFHDGVPHFVQIVSLLSSVPRDTDGCRSTYGNSDGATDGDCDDFRRLVVAKGAQHAVVRDRAVEVVDLLLRALALGRIARAREAVRVIYKAHAVLEDAPSDRVAPRDLAEIRVFLGAIHGRKLAPALRIASRHLRAGVRRRTRDVRVVAHGVGVYGGGVAVIVGAKAVVVARRVAGGVGAGGGDVWSAVEGVRCARILVVAADGCRCTVAGSSVAARSTCAGVLLALHDVEFALSSGAVAGIQRAEVVVVAHDGLDDAGTVGLEDVGEAGVSGGTREENMDAHARGRIARIRSGWVSIITLHNVVYALPSGL